MSIVVAVKKDNKVVIGADSQHSFGSNQAREDNIQESKIIKYGSSYISYTGWGIYHDIIEDYLSKNRGIRFNKKLDVFRFFTKFWHTLHKRYSFVNDQCDNNDESPFGDLDSSFIVVNKKHIYHISANMSVTEFHKFHAIGSGCDFALGAMHVLFDKKASAEQIAKQAIDAAITHNIYCGGNIETIIV